MDSNNMYQNQSNAGGEPENSQSGVYSSYEQNPYGQDQNYQNTYDQNQNYQNPYNQNTDQQYSYNTYNANYQAPYGQDSRLELEEPVKLSEWLISFLIMMIPCAGFIMPFVWAFSGNEKKSKSNFFKAYLIMLGIFFAVYLILVIVMVAVGISLS
ncbi:MAG: hypothetical protein NC434_13610 [Ruminococcus sp.]|nr:hypothetical protein [Ruminococcus sp.]